MESDLFVGSRIRLTSIQNVGMDPRCKVTHKPPKGKVYVAVLIGIEEQKVTGQDDIITAEEAIKRLKMIAEEETGEVVGGEITKVQGIAAF